jgi:hypothetical protein
MKSVRMWKSFRPAQSNMLMARALPARGFPKKLPPRFGTLLANIPAGSEWDEL